MSGPAQRRQQCRVCWSIKGRRDRRDGGKDIDNHHWAAEGDNDSGRAGGDSADRGDQHKDSLPTSPVRQRRSQRRDYGRRHHAQQTHQSDRGRTALAVGNDSQAHGEGPLGRPSPEKAQLSAAQITVHRIADERGSGRLQPAPQRLFHSW
jgi:hypothetical protein